MHQNKRPAGQGRGADEAAHGQSNYRAGVTSLQTNDDDVAIAVEGYRELVPDGQYEAKFVGHYTALMFKMPKVVLRFEIVEHGELFEKKFSFCVPIAWPVSSNQ